MTVEELIRQLQRHDGDLDVVIVEPAKGEPMDIGGVHVSEGSPDDDEPRVIEISIRDY